MSSKTTCPSCDAHLSSIYDAFCDGRPCPNCGLPAAVYQQVRAAQMKYLDDERTAQLTAAIAARGKAEAERDEYLNALLRIQEKATELAQEIEAEMKPLDVKVQRMRDAHRRDGW